MINADEIYYLQFYSTLLPHHATCLKYFPFYLTCFLPPRHIECNAPPNAVALGLFFHIIISVSAQNPTPNPVTYSLMKETSAHFQERLFRAALGQDRFPLHVVDSTTVLVI